MEIKKIKLKNYKSFEGFSGFNNKSGIKIIGENQENRVSSGTGKSFLVDLILKDSIALLKKEIKDEIKRCINDKSKIAQ